MAISPPLISAYYRQAPNWGRELSFREAVLPLTYRVREDGLQTAKEWRCDRQACPVDGGARMKAFAIALVILLPVCLSGCEGQEGPTGPRGPAGPQGPAGPLGAQGEQGAPGNLAIRAVSDPCPQSCTLSCSDNERVLNAYVVGRSKAPIHTSEQTVDFDNRGARGAGPATIFCIPK